MRHVCRRVALASALSVSVAFVAVPSSAQPPAPSSDASKGTPTKLEEARQRYERGLQLFNEANYEAARVEFERAYQLAPTYKILYNVGLCYEQLGDYVQALTTLQRYLEQGGSEISTERRAEVAKELNQIRPRIAKVTLHTNVPGSELLVDDACATEATSGNVQCGPLDSISRVVLMNPGRRRVTLRHENYFPETQVVTVAGSDQIEVTINLKPLPKNVAEKKSNPWLLPMWIGVGVTGAGLVTAGVTGYLAKNASDDQQAAVDKFPADRSSLDDAKNKTKTLATVTDGVLIGSAVTGVITAYLVYRALNWKQAESSNVNVQVGLGSVGLNGRF